MIDFIVLARFLLIFWHSEHIWQ